MFYVFLAMAALIALTQWNYSKSIRELFYAVINVRKLREILREEIVLTSRASQIMMVLAQLSVAMFGYLFVTYYDISLFGINLSGFLLYVLILTFNIFFYFVKISVTYLLKFFFKGDYSLTEYEFNYKLLFKVAGLGLFPISLLIAYSPLLFESPLFYLGIGLIVASALWIWARGWLNAMSNRISIVYIILYLCTLEILPVAVLLKVVG